MLVWTDRKMKDFPEYADQFIPIISDGFIEDKGFDFLKEVLNIPLNYSVYTNADSWEYIYLDGWTMVSNMLFYVEPSIDAIKIKGKKSGSNFEQIYYLNESTNWSFEWPENVILTEVNTAVEAYRLYTTTTNKIPIFEKTPNFMLNLESNKTEKQIYDLTYDKYDQIKTMQNPYYFINHNRISGLGFYNSKTNGQFKYNETSFKNNNIKKSKDAPLLSLLGSDPELIYHNFDLIQTEGYYPTISISKITDSNFKITINERSSYFFNPQKDEVIFLRRKGAEEITFKNNSKSNIYKMAYSIFNSIYEAEGYDYLKNPEVSFVKEIVQNNDQDTNNYCPEGCYIDFSAPPKDYDLTFTLPSPELFILKDNTITTDTIKLTYLLNTDNNLVDKTTYYDFLYETIGKRNITINSENIGLAPVKEYIYNQGLGLGAKMQVSRSYIDLIIENYTKPYKVSTEYAFSFKLISDLSISEIQNEPNKHARGIGTVLINELRSSYGMFATTYISNNSENSLLYNSDKDSCYRIYGYNGLSSWKNQKKSTFQDFWNLQYYDWENYYNEKEKAIASAGATYRLVNNFGHTRISKKNETKVSLATVNNFSFVNITYTPSIEHPHWFWYNDVFILNPKLSYDNASENKQLPLAKDGYVDFPYNEDDLIRDNSDGYAIYIIRNQKL